MEKVSLAVLVFVCMSCKSDIGKKEYHYYKNSEKELEMLIYKVESQFNSLEVSFNEGSISKAEWLGIKEKNKLFKKDKKEYRRINKFILPFDTIDYRQFIAVGNSKIEYPDFIPASHQSRYDQCRSTNRGNASIILTTIYQEKYIRLMEDLNEINAGYFFYPSPLNLLTTSNTYRSEGKLKILSLDSFEMDTLQIGDSVLVKLNGRYKVDPEYWNSVRKDSVDVKVWLFDTLFKYRFYQKEFTFLF